MDLHGELGIEVRDGFQYVCALPGPAKKLYFENGCLMAVLESGASVLVPIEASAGEVRN